MSTLHFDDWRKFHVSEVELNCFNFFYSRTCFSSEKWAAWQAQNETSKLVQTKNAFLGTPSTCTLYLQCRLRTTMYYSRYNCTSIAFSVEKSSPLFPIMWYNHFVDRVIINSSKLTRCTHYVIVTRKIYELWANSQVTRVEHRPRSELSLWKRLPRTGCGTKSTFGQYWGVNLSAGITCSPILVACFITHSDIASGWKCQNTCKSPKFRNLIWPYNFLTEQNGSENEDSQHLTIKRRLIGRSFTQERW